MTRARFGSVLMDVEKSYVQMTRYRAEQSLYEFMRQGWQYIDSSPFTPGWPIEAVAEHLQAVADGDLRRLIINIPPRCSKSSLTSVAFPAWVWAQQKISPTSGPGVQFLHASYAQSLSLRDSVKCRRLIESPWYQDRWGDRFTLTSDQNTKTRFDNNKNGSRLSTSVGSALTGEGGSCFPDGTKVSTPIGKINIEDILPGMEVTAFDHSQGKVVNSRVVAVQSRESDDIYEVCTIKGISFRCTGSHPIFVEGRGYIPASKLGEGDRLIGQGGSQDHRRADLRELRHPDDESSIRNPQKLKAGRVGLILQQAMLFRASICQKLAEMRRLREPSDRQAQKVLLTRMQGNPWGQAVRLEEAKEVLSKVRRYCSEEYEHLLQLCVRGCRSFRSYVGISQFKVYGIGQVFEPVQAISGNSAGTGWAQVLRVPATRCADKALSWKEKVNFTGASYRREYEEQQAREFDIVMYEMPQTASSWETDRISEVRRIGGQKIRVHDIQVERFSNFFAEGILAHNCIIVDDPNAAQEAFSEATIQSTIDWWDNALSTRLNDPKTGAFIVIQQRLSEEDLTGHILSKAHGDWTHLCLPMRYEPERSFVTGIGWKDPRKEQGELLWPERFGEPEVDLLERQLGPWGSAGQLQQRPEPKGGGVIKRDWWQLWEHDNYPPVEYIVASLDTAYTTKTENDFSAMTVWGTFSGGDQKAIATRVMGKDGELISTVKRTYTEEHPKVFLLNAWQERLELHELVEKVLATMKQFKVDKILIENKAAGHSVAQEIRRLYGHEDFAVQLIDPKGQDKLARLHSVAHLFAEGLIYAPDRQYADMVITQCATFPRGKHDDLVDTVAMGMRHLRELGLLVRGTEWTAEIQSKMVHHGAAPGALYPV